MSLFDSVCTDFTAESKGASRDVSVSSAATSPKTSGIAARKSPNVAICCLDDCREKPIPYRADFRLNSRQKALATGSITRLNAPVRLA
jgi:hypothetical protein